MRIFKQPRNIFWLIIGLVIFALVIDLPKNFPLKIDLGFWKADTIISSPELDFKAGPFSFSRDLEIKKGLDIKGGIHLVLEADMKDIEQEKREEALEAAKGVIERRVNLFGVSEANVQTSLSGGQYRIIVDLPGAQNIDQAISLIGQTAQLDFRQLPADIPATASADIWQFEKSGLTGNELKDATLDYSPETGEPVVALRFNSEGAEKFKEITSANIGKPLAIFLDDMPITAPTVNEVIPSGEAIISGSFDVKSAKSLAIQLQAGALPAPISIIQQKSVGATLGEESVSKSLSAGLIGLVIVMLFMWIMYGRLGFIANMALLIYALLTLAIYKLIPITLTLPGLAGFILSVGMAVDSNILIFERMKEELRMNKPLPIAMELGFGRAWDSIKDANVCTLITAFVLFNPLDWSFLNKSGMLRCFALTLSIGIAISLFTGIVVTRNFVRLFYQNKNKKI